MLPACGSMVTIVANPTAAHCSRRKITAIIGQLRQHGVAATLLESSTCGHARELTQQAVNAGANTVVAAGGDGTINEVANGLLNSGVQLAILPMGTANVLAREIGLRASDAVRVLLEGRPRNIHMGRDGANYFTLMAGFGFDAGVVHAIDLQRKSVLGKFEYALQAIQQWQRLQLGQLQVCIDAEVCTGYSVIVSNAHYYGGNFNLAPGAGIDQPALAVTVFQGQYRRDLLRYAAAICRGCHAELPDVVIRYGRRVQISSVTGQPIPVQIDGDCRGFTPRDLHIAENALTLLTP